MTEGPSDDRDIWSGTEDDDGPDELYGFHLCDEFGDALPCTPSDYEFRPAGGCGKSTEMDPTPIKRTERPRLFKCY